MCNLAAAHLPAGRPFSWRALWALVLLQLFGNIASLPLMRATDAPAESPVAWALWTAASVLLIGISLFMGRRIGLGAPFLEGLLPREERMAWLRRIVGLSILLSVGASLPVLLINLNVNPETYPARWKLVLASIDAGVQEEIFSRLFLVTLLVWLGSLRWREADGRPAHNVIWAAITFSALFFGWAHIDQQLTSADILALAAIFLISALLGLTLGWLYWKQGIECAMLAHFAVDAVDSAIVVPAYLSGNVWIQAATVVGLLALGVLGWWLVRGGEYSMR